MHKTRAAVLILFLASTLAFGGCLVRQQTGKDGKGPEITMDNSEISASIHAEAVSYTHLTLPTIA